MESWATEGKINTDQASPGTRAIPRGILGMWLGMSGLALLPHPENCPVSPKNSRKDREFAPDVSTDEEGETVMCSRKHQGSCFTKSLPCTRILNFPLWPNPPSMTPVSPVDKVTFNPTKSWRLVSFLNRLRPITV